MTSEPANELPVDQLAYEDAFDQLEKVVSALESGEHSLDETLALFQRGQALSRRCAALLEQAEIKITQLALP